VKSFTSTRKRVLLNWTTRQHHNSLFRERRDAVEAGKIFARAAGFAETDVATIGQKSPQDFAWDSNEENVSFSVEIHLNKRGNLWDLYFNLGTGTLAP